MNGQQLLSPTEAYDMICTAETLAASYQVGSKKKEKKRVGINKEQVVGIAKPPMEIESALSSAHRCWWLCARRKTTTYDDHLHQSPASAWGPLKPSYSSYDYTVGAPRPGRWGPPSSRRVHFLPETSVAIRPPMDGDDDADNHRHALSCVPHTHRIYNQYAILGLLDLIALAFLPAA